MAFYRPANWRAALATAQQFFDTFNGAPGAPLALAVVAQSTMELITQVDLLRDDIEKMKTILLAKDTEITGLRMEIDRILKRDAEGLSR